MMTVELQFDRDVNYFMREAFNTLRTNVLFCGTETKVIALTSCFAHEGKTTVSLELARTLAESDRHVLYIDADLRKSITVSRYTNQTGIAGLSQLLSGQATLGETLYRTQISGLDVIFAGPFPPNPTELVGSEAFRQLIEAVRPHYDYVIIDSPPLGLVVDAAVIAGACDGAILVVHQGKIKYRVAQGVVEQLKKSGCRILGAVLNQPERSRDVLPDASYYKRYKKNG